MGRPTNEERARRAAAAVAAADPTLEEFEAMAVANENVVEPPVSDVNKLDAPPEIVEPAPFTVLHVPPESYSVASSVFMRQVLGWIDEVQRESKRRGEQLVLVAPKE